MSTKEKDKYELALDEALESLKRCQQEKNVHTCSLCEHFLACELRGEYVKKVYESMSKGSSGGFDF